MRIAYLDESGDDGYPQYSSEIFTLSTVYLHYLQWKENFERIRELRRSLRQDFGLPVKTELHAKYFLLNKKPYRQFRISDSDRIAVLDLFCDLIGDLDARIINVAIIKPRIVHPDYRVLDTALKYLVQRIENDLRPDQNPQAKFLMITDPGRVGKMRSTTRRIQQINYIPSRFGPQPYRREITALIEDPLPKDSRESYFIQVADLVAFVVYLRMVFETGVCRIHGRMPAAVDAAKVEDWLCRLEPSLNLEASGAHPFGIVVHPT
jgi:hypothetical protein